MASIADQTTKSTIGIAAAIAIGALVSWAGSDGGARIGSIAVFALCGLLAFAVNWLVFIPSNAARTEKYYDLTGSVVYVIVTLVAVLLSDNLDARAVVVAAMMVVWAGRLGTYLFRRIRREGKDSRFDEIKTSTLRFFMSWTIQGLWVLLTAAAALATITTTRRHELGWESLLGIAVWLAGFTIEAAADWQKSKFKQDPDNDGRFIFSGLWAWSRHPNYFGEITLWTGVAILAIPILSGWQWAVLISPVFVTILLTQISGIPILEKKADQRWGDEKAYQQYKNNTPVLIPRPPSYEN